MMKIPDLRNRLLDSRSQQLGSYGLASSRLGRALAFSMVLALSTSLTNPAWASDAEPSTSKATGKVVKKPNSPEPGAKPLADQVQEAVESSAAAKKRLTLTVNGKDKKLNANLSTESPVAAAAPSKRTPGGTLPPVLNPVDSHLLIRAKAAEMATAGLQAKTDKPAGGSASSQHGEIHWAYSGEAGPQAWGQLKPEFQTCTSGTRQSPVNIDDATTLQGPAEPLQFRYQASSGSVVNNGYTIQVDVQGDNTLTVRGSEYKLVQFHFHTPSEERINNRSFAMAAHLLHRNQEGQLAMVAVLLEPGAANSLIHAVWTHMPLDINDRVRLPSGSINLQDLLPQDQRYYQFLGSLSTPPCTEGVLWMVIKQPAAVSREQIRLFTQLYPNNTRPVQPLNGRAVREAQ
jgi:carbonic anhydrase